jgi:hypothetical protein
MTSALTSAGPRHLMEPDGIGYYFTGAHAGHSQACLDAGKNEVAIETLELSHEGLDAGAQGIIAILIGL